MNRDVKHTTFGDELMLLYGRARLSQGEFARLVGVSTVALRKWESGESCPKAESLKRIIEILLRQGVFSRGEEQTGAMQMWELAKQRGLKVPFDEVWFSTIALVPSHTDVADAHPTIPDVSEHHQSGAIEIVPDTFSNHQSEAVEILPDTSNHHQSEVVEILPDTSNHHQAEAVEILPDINPGPTPAKTRARYKGRLVLLLALVVLIIIGSAGALFFYMSGHGTDQTYPSYLSGHGTLLFSDPLREANGSQWSPDYSPPTGGECQFMGGAYHIKQQPIHYFQMCPTREIYDNFAFEVQLTITQGDCGGMLLRMESFSYFYYFLLCENGTYRIMKYIEQTGTHAETLIGGSSPVIHAGLGRQNKIAVVANGSLMTFYINEQLISQVPDSSYTRGHIALIAAPYLDYGHVTEVVYRDARLWAL